MSSTALSHDHKNLHELFTSLYIQSKMSILLSQTEMNREIELTWFVGSWILLTPLLVCDYFSAWLCVGHTCI